MPANFDDDKVSPSTYSTMDHYKNGLHNEFLPNDGHLTNGHTKTDESSYEVPVKKVSTVFLVYPDEQKEKKDVRLPMARRRISHRQSSTGMSDMRTEWRSVIIASIVMFLNGIQFSLRLSSLWPYLQQIDDTVRPSFFGWVVAAFSLAQLISSLLGGFMANAIKKTRTPIAVGVFFLFSGNMLFNFVEAFEQDKRKWILLIARVLMGTGAGTVSILRAFIAQSTVPKDKARAISTGAGSFAVGVVIGPGVQAAFTPIGYPGFVSGKFHLDMYTAPGYFAGVINFIMFFVLFTLFKENFVGLSKENTSGKKNKYYKLPRYDHTAAWFCVGVWFVMLFGYTNLETIGTPFTMAMFDWDKTQAVLFNGIVQALSGVISFLVYIMLGVVYPNKVPVRPTLLIGMLLLLCFYIITFPWPGLPHMPDYKIQELVTQPTVINSTEDSISTLTHFLSTTTAASNDSITTAASHTPVGCEVYYSWCKTTPKVEEIQYFIGMFVSALCFPVTNVVLSPLFSNIIGPRRQETMQGFFVGSGSFARFIGPIFISKMFDDYGPRVPWAVIIALTLLMLVATLLLYKRLKPLDAKPKLKPGESYRYKNGILYHF